MPNLRCTSPGPCPGKCLGFFACLSASICTITSYLSGSRRLLTLILSGLPASSWACTQARSLAAGSMGCGSKYLRLLIPLLAQLHRLLHFLAKHDSMRALDMCRACLHKMGAVGGHAARPVPSRFLCRAGDAAHTGELNTTAPDLHHRSQGIVSVCWCRWS